VLFDPTKNTATAICETIEAAGYAIVVEGDEKTVEIESAKQPPVAQAGRQDQLHIENMDCPTEEALIRNKLKGFPGVTGLDFNLLQRTLTISHTLPSLDSVKLPCKPSACRGGRWRHRPNYPKKKRPIGGRLLYRGLPL